MKLHAVLFSLALIGCGPSASDYVDAGGGGGGGGDDGGGGGGGGNEFADAAPAEACEKMDILFVIDDSGSMAEEQGNLGTNFPQFIQVLDNYMTEGGGLLDYRVGVTTTGRDLTWNLELPGFPPIPFPEFGPNGQLLQDSGCGMSRPWLERDDGNVSTAFPCVANVGTSGSSYEMPLYATELALVDRVNDGSNAGFLREDALLAIVILTDEDDCSRPDDNFSALSDSCSPEPAEALPVDHFLTVLDGVKLERGRWAAAVIAGPGPGTCSSSFGEAFEATRLKQFVSLVGTNAVFSSICDGDLSGSLEDALDTFDAACSAFPPIP